MGVVDPRRDWSGPFALVSGLLAMLFVGKSLRRKERQVLLLLLNVVLDFSVLVSPLGCV